MPIRDLLWACPLCTRVSGLRPERRTERCIGCKTEFSRGRGAEIVARSPGKPPIQRSPAEWLDSLPAFPQLRASGAGPEPAILRRAEPQRRVFLHGELLGWAERFEKGQQGQVRLDNSHVMLLVPGGWQAQWPLESLTAIQLSSNALQIRARGHAVISVRFLRASVLLWEHWLQQAVRARFLEIGKGAIVEFQPHISVR